MITIHRVNDESETVYILYIEFTNRVIEFTNSIFLNLCFCRGLDVESRYGRQQLETSGKIANRATFAQLSNNENASFQKKQNSKRPMKLQGFVLWVAYIQR